MAGLTQVIQISREKAVDLRDRLEEAGFAFHDVQHALFGAKGEGTTLVYYTSGKLVLQGKEIREFLEKWLPDDAPRAPEVKEALIGADEAGKGDYFGPLVCASCLLDPDVARFLDEVPLRDSKTLSAREIAEAAETLRRVLPHEIVMIGPSKYNELYPKFGNLNSMLAWAHAKAIMSVVQKTNCKRILLDKFADESVMRRALGTDYAGLEFRMETKAESVPAVAAASILARDAFVRGVQKLSREIGMPLPLGAGEPVDRAVRALVAQKGDAVLGEVAKLHFKNTQKRFG